MELFQIKKLDFTYPDTEKPALSGIDLTIRSGEFITLCGQSGSGKTTLLRLLKPALAPAGERNGVILYGGQPLCEVPERRQAAEIGFVMQNPENQLVTNKVWHELAFGLESLGVPNHQIRGRVSEMAAFLGMEEWFHKKVDDLSGGQKQLLNLASALVLRPEVLILDEPTGQLDPIAAGEFLRTLSRINRELGTTIILSEHRLEEAIPLSHRVLVMEDGRLIADAKPKGIGKALRNHPMYHALPAPIRIHDVLDGETESPINVGEGRLWLTEYGKTNSLWQERIPKAEDRFAGAEVMLEMKDVRFRYQKEEEDVLQNLSLSVRQGEIYALLGGNGAGKSTVLSLLAGMKEHQGGTILFRGIALSRLPAGVTGLLPQDPKLLFVHKTVRLDLEESLPQHLPDEEREEKLLQMAKLCRISHLLNRHPYDLSGGELQRTALAKVLLTNPELLLLDEPTKGMDGGFKGEFAGILRELTKQGRAVIMVSHDIEFCGEYADRCGLLFDGGITAENLARPFFAGMSFYTTAVSRMAGKMIPNAILPEDVLKAFGKEPKEPPTMEYPVFSQQDKREETMKDKPKKKGSGIQKGLGILLAAAFLVTCFVIKQPFAAAYSVWLQMVSVLELGACFLCFFPPARKEKLPVFVGRGGITKGTWLAALWVLLAVPLTVFLGMVFFEDRKYYLISLLILAETLLPFFLLWERRKNTARELVIVSVLCAIGVAGREAFAILPQFKPVLAIVILAGICFGGETGFLVGAVTAFVSNFFLGQGPWTPWQMLATGMVGFLAGIVFWRGRLPQNPWILPIFGFLATLLLYGGILNPASVLLYQENPTAEMFLTSYAMGFPFDLIHAVSTAFFLGVLQKSMGEKLLRIKTKYGI